MVGGSDEVTDIGGEARVLKFALGRAKPREIEPQDGKTKRGQLRGDATSRNNILRARKAMCEQGVSADLPRREVQTARQLMTETAREGHADCMCTHDDLLNSGQPPFSHACGLA